MTTYARIEAGIVVERLESAGAIETMFSPELVWVPCPATTLLGSIFDGAAFHAAAAHREPTTWPAIKVRRDAIKAGGAEVGGRWYHSDEISRTKYIALLRVADAAVAAGGNDATVLQCAGQAIDWKTMDGSFIEMTVALANAVFDAVSALDFTAFAVAEAHRVALDAAANPAAYDFSGGWPTTFGM